MKTKIRLNRVVDTSKNCDVCSGFATSDYIHYQLEYIEEGVVYFKQYHLGCIANILIAQITEEEARDEHSNNRMTKMHVYDVESMYPNINERKG